MLSSPVSSRWIGVPTGAERDSHAFSTRENEPGSMASRDSQDPMESRTGVVSTPP
jgi:hypothetical protein